VSGPCFVDGNPLLAGLPVRGKDETPGRPAGEEDPGAFGSACAGAQRIIPEEALWTMAPSMSLLPMP